MRAAALLADTYRENSVLPRCHEGFMNPCRALPQRRRFPYKQMSCFIRTFVLTQIQSSEKRTLIDLKPTLIDCASVQKLKSSERITHAQVRLWP